MPGGFNLNAVKGHLSKAWGIGPMRADGVLLLGLTMEPPKRLGSETEAKAWIDSLVPMYAQRSGISLSQGGAGGAAGGSGGGAVINSEEFLKFQTDQDRFAAQQVDLWMRYLKRDVRAGEIKYDAEKANTERLQSRLDAIAREHGDTYIDGVQPVFDALKARHFDSSWNWVRQDALLMFYDIIFGRLTTVDREITARCIAIMNRADPDLITYMQYYIDQCDPERGETYKLAKQFGQQLIDNCREVVDKPPLYKDGTFIYYMQIATFTDSILQSPSPLLLTPRSQHEVILFTLKLSVKEFASLRPMLKRWQAVTMFPDLSICKKFRMTSQNCGML